MTNKILNIKIICCKEIEISSTTTKVKSTNCNCLNYYHYTSCLNNELYTIFSFVYKGYGIFYNYDTTTTNVIYYVSNSKKYKSFKYNQKILNLNDIISKYHNIITLQ